RNPELDRPDAARNSVPAGHADRSLCSGLHRVCRKVRHLPVPHMVTGSPCKGTVCGERHTFRRPPECWDLRYYPRLCHRAPDHGGRSSLSPARHLRTPDRRHRCHLHAFPEEPQETGCLFEHREHGDTARWPCCLDTTRTILGALPHHGTLIHESLPLLLGWDPPPPVPEYDLSRCR